MRPTLITKDSVNLPAEDIMIETLIVGSIFIVLWRLPDIIHALMAGRSRTTNKVKEKRVRDAARGALRGKSKHAYLTEFRGVL